VDPIVWGRTPKIVSDASERVGLDGGVPGDRGLVGNPPAPGALAAPLGRLPVPATAAPARPVAAAS
jgi:hypothetical protein